MAKIIPIMLAIMLVAFMSCGTPGYKKYTLREGIAHFSLEYPEGYENVLASTQFGYVDVVFHQSLPEYDYIDSSISVVIHTVAAISELYENAKAAIEWSISHLSGYFPDYQVLERKEINIDGVPAELLVGSFTMAEVPEDDVWNTGRKLDRQVYFDYDGCIWHISMTSDEENAEADEAVWEHLLETFTILD